MDLGCWRYVTAGLFIVYFFCVVLLPFLVLLWSSLQKFYSVPSWQAVQNLTIQPYLTVLNFPSVGTAVWNSFMLAIGAVIGAGIFGAIGTAAAGQIGPNGEVIRYAAGPALVLSFILLGAACALAATATAQPQPCSRVAIASRTRASLSMQSTKLPVSSAGAG